MAQHKLYYVKKKPTIWGDNSIQFDSDDKNEAIVFCNAMKEDGVVYTWPMITEKKVHQNYPE